MGNLVHRVHALTKRISRKCNQLCQRLKELPLHLQTQDATLVAQAYVLAHAPGLVLEAVLGLVQALALALAPGLVLVLALDAAEHVLMVVELDVEDVTEPVLEAASGTVLAGVALDAEDVPADAVTFVLADVVLLALALALAGVRVVETLAR